METTKNSLGQYIVNGMCMCIYKEKMGGDET